MVTQLLVARGMPKATQAAARYTPAGGRERCGGCRHFMAPSVCNRILGPVTAAGWCRYYSQKPPHRAANFPGMGPPGASLALNFMSPGTLDPRITFTRVGTATYFNSAGVMQTAAANAPRWDYDPNTHALQGLLIEEARTNIWLQSADASNAAWLTASITAAAPVVTGNQTTAPDGTLTAARVVYPAVSGAGNASLLFQGIVVTANPYTFSAYMKGSVGGEQLYILAENSGATVFYKTRVTLTTAWQRVSVTTPALTAASWNFVIGCDLRDGTQTSIAAGTVFIWGGQLEQAAFASSYIPTAGAAVTRAADAASMSAAPWYSATASTMAVDAMFPAVNAGTQTMATLDDGTTSNIARFYRVLADANLYAQLAGGTAYNPALGAFSSSVVTKAAMAWQAGNQSAALNGVLGAGATGALIPAGITTLRLGALAGPIQILCGWVQRVRYWPRVLSSAELQQVTT